MLKATTQPNREVVVSFSFDFARKEKKKKYLVLKKIKQIIQKKSLKLSFSNFFVKFGTNFYKAKFARTIIF